jgi:hypothetical protein
VTGGTKDNAMSTLPDQVDEERELQRVAVHSSVDDDSSLDKAYVVRNVLSPVEACWRICADHGDGWKRPLFSPEDIAQATSP